jgi:hypothetical protein
VPLEDTTGAPMALSAVTMAVRKVWMTGTMGCSRADSLCRPPPSGAPLALRW